MSDCRPEVADVFRGYGPQFFASFGHSISIDQKRVFRDLSRCRTAALGGHKRKCDDCGNVEFSYNSCRNRHCPKCQATSRAEWLDQEATQLLEVEYFHVVFTLPDEIGPITLQNKRQIYGLLFRAASETLLTIARDPKHLGAEIGFLMVLHTWGQNLHLHPHVHCVVPGGGLSPDGSRWISCRKAFFLPVRVLSRLFREKFIAYLEAQYAKGELSFSGKIASLREVSAWRELIASLRQTEWVVYAKPPFGGPKQVLKYLARYTHRVAISNQRLISIDGGKVAFHWKDYAHGGKRKIMTLEAAEFIRRFLLHVLPKGLVRIRHYGFLANRVRVKKLTAIRKLLAQTSLKAGTTLSITADSEEKIMPEYAPLCPRCKKGHLVLVEVILPDKNLNRRHRFSDTC